MTSRTQSGASSPRNSNSTKQMVRMTPVFSLMRSCTDICRLRDLLAHQYHRVDPSIIRSTCDQPLAALSAAPPALRALIADELMLDE